MIQAQAAQTNAIIYNEYPRCDYTLVENVDVKVRTPNSLTSLTPTQYAKAIDKISKRLKLLASRADADTIILGKKESILIRRKHYLSFNAELISGCEPDNAFERKLAKYNKQGQLQMSLSNQAFEMETKLVIEMPSIEKRLTPGLSVDSVSLLTGVYGMNLGSAYKEVIEVFGTPTLEMNPNARQKVIAYGRNHLFFFNDDKLQSVKSKHDYFSSDLRNLTEFDDRFDYINWNVMDESGALKFTKQQRIKNTEVDIAKNNTISFENQDSVLSVEIEPVSGASRSEGLFVVVAYELSLKGGSPMEELSPKINDDIQSLLAQYINKPNPPFRISDIPFPADLNAWLGANKRLHAYGQHIAIETRGEKVSKVHIFENLYSGDSIFKQNSNWQLGSLRQDMLAADAQKVVGEDGFYFNDTLEIEGSNVTQKYYFYEQSKQVRLYAAELLIYD